MRPRLLRCGRAAGRLTKTLGTRYTNTAACNYRTMGLAMIDDSEPESETLRRAAEGIRRRSARRSRATGRGCGGWSSSGSTAGCRGGSTRPTCSRRRTWKSPVAWRDYLKNPEIPFYLWVRFITGRKLQALHRHHLGTLARDAGREVVAPPRGAAAGQLRVARRATPRPVRQPEPGGRQGRTADPRPGSAQRNGPDRPRGSRPAALRGAEQRRDGPGARASAKRPPATGSSGPCDGSSRSWPVGWTIPGWRGASKS